MNCDDLEMSVGILAKGKEATGSVNRKNGCVTLGGGVVVLARELARREQEDINGILGSVMVMIRIGGERKHEERRKERRQKSG